MWLAEEEKNVVYGGIIQALESAWYLLVVGLWRSYLISLVSSFIKQNPICILAVRTNSQD